MYPGTVTFFDGLLPFGPAQKIQLSLCVHHINMVYCHHVHVYLLHVFNTNQNVKSIDQFLSDCLFMFTN